MVTIERYIVGAWEANCYLLTSQDETLVIDPGAQPGLLLPILKNHNVKAIVATHGHSDHIGAINEIRSEYLCPVFIGKDDAEMARNPIYSGFADEGSSYRVTDCEFVTEGSLITVGEEVLSVIETQGIRQDLYASLIRKMPSSLLEIRYSGMESDLLHLYWETLRP